MSLLKELRKLAIVSTAFVALSYGATPANAALTYTSAGNCVGADNSGGAGVDCVATVGHISASVTSTLSINEIRAISFGNMARPAAGNAAAGDSEIVLDAITGERTVAGTNTDAVYLLNGAGANGGGGAAYSSAGSQFPGLLRVSGGDEAGTDRVYISFATTDGKPVDFDGDDNFTANDSAIHVTKVGGGTEYFTVKDFTINCVNSPDPSYDVYGHFCDNTTMPFDVRVGATLATVATQVYTVGRYEGTYTAMVSY